MTIADDILRQVSHYGVKPYTGPMPLIQSAELAEKVILWQRMGYITSAKVKRNSEDIATLMEVVFTAQGVKAVIVGGPDQGFDTEFLTDQIAEYSDQLPKGFLEGLKAAEGILKGTDFLENYLDV